MDCEYSDGNYQSTVSGSSVTSGAEERRKISRAEECFITKRPGFYLKKAHWVNPVRKNVWLKKNVVRLMEIHLQFSNILKNSLIQVTRANIFHSTDSPHSQMPRANSSLIIFCRREVQSRFSRRTGTYLLSGKMYVVSLDGALRQGRENDKAIFPAFMSNNSCNEPEHTLNPFLVVINAEIAFRRFRRCPSPPTLCPEYMELIDLTIELVDEIYFQPTVKSILSIDNFGTGKRRKKDKDKIITSGAARSKGSRMGTVVKDPGPGAPHDKVLEYELYNMSGCGISLFLLHFSSIVYGLCPFA